MDKYMLHALGSGFFVLLMLMCGWTLATFTKSNCVGFVFVAAAIILPITHMGQHEQPHGKQ